MRIVFWIRCILIFAASSFAVANTAPTLPDGIDADDWAQIQQQIQAQRFHAQAGDVTGGWQAANLAHGFQIDYRPDGQTVLTLVGEASAEHRIALQLQGYGYGEALIPVTEPATLSANGNTVTYQWKPGLREWWINNEQGVAQWFELAERPMMNDPNSDHDQPLVVAMTLNTELNASVADNALTLSTGYNGTTITYDRLKVWDATGRVLTAEMALDGRRLALQVDDSNAVYPVTIDPTFAQRAYLKAANSDANDEFGFSIAAAGDTVVVGARFEESDADGVNGDPADNSASDAGAVYVFVRSGTDWSQQAYLKAANSDADDRFGWSVAIAGDTVVVGAPGEASAADDVNGDPADNSAPEAGAAYVFVRSGTSWSQQTYLKAANSDADDWFGSSVAVAGNTVVVGAPLEDSASTGVNGNSADNFARNAGATYVFVRSGTNWTQQAYLKAANSDADDWFGDSVAVAGDTVVVGAIREDSAADGVNGDPADNSATEAGAVYVFVRSGTSWSQQAYLKAANSDAVDWFGGSVAIAGDTVVVGVPFEDSAAVGVNGDSADNSLSRAGAGYVFVRSGTSWSQQAYLKAANSDVDDEFGRSVDIEGDTVVVGAPREASAAAGVNGNTADNSAINAGAAYVFVRSGTSWSQQAYLKAANSDAGDRFGLSVAVAGDTKAVGALREDSAASGVNGDSADNSASSAGAAYVFESASSVGGTVTGLNGTGLVLQNNGGDDLQIMSDGSFTFGTGVFDGSAYAVTVAIQPTGLSQTCSVSNATGTLAGADVTDIEVTCVTNTFTVGGTVSCLSGSGLVLQNNGGDDLSIKANGAFTFPTALDDGSTYAVTVTSQPISPSQTCTVGTSSGTIDNADVSNVTILCILNGEGMLEPAAIGFGSVLIDQTSIVEPLVLGNLGNGNLTVDRVALTGSAADQYSLVLDECSQTLLTPGQNCDVSVRFQPTSTGLKLARLEVSSDDPDSPAISDLNGIGIDEDNLFSDSFE